MCYIQPQLRTELVQNVTGPGQRTKRDHFDMSKVGLSKVGEATRMAIDVLDPLRQVLDSRHAVQQFVPASLASGFPCFCSCGFRGCKSLLGHPLQLSFALRHAHSHLPLLRSYGAEVYQMMALRPRAAPPYISIWSVNCCDLYGGQFGDILSKLQKQGLPWWRSG